MGFDLLQSLPSLRFRMSSQKHHQQLTWLDTASLCKRVLANYVPHLGGRAQNHIGMKAKLALDRILDPFPQTCQVLLLAAEDHIATIYERLWLLQPQSLTNNAQLAHVDFVVTSQVHTPEHRNDR